MKIEQQRLAKLFLILCVIFSVGTVLGVAGYLAKNRAVKISQPQVSVAPVIEGNKTIDDLLLAETQKLEKEGVSGEKYQIKSKTEFQTGNNDYLLVIFGIDFKKGSIYDIAKIYSRNNNALTGLYEQKGHYINNAEVKDINKDGISEIILDLSTGGNCSGCDSIKILQIKNQKAENLEINFPDNVTPFVLIDLDNDGTEEIIGIDTHWAFYGSVCHACSPGVEVVAKWDDIAYQMASGKFTDFYNNKIKDIETKLKNPFDEQYYFGDLISLLLNYIVKGEKEKGFAEFKKYANSYEFETPELKAEILRIKKDLNKWMKEEGVDQLSENALVTFSNSELGLSFKYSIKLGKVDFQIRDGETGRRFLGGVSDRSFSFGGITKDYSYPSEGGFLINQGYYESKGKYYFKFVGTDKILIEPLKIIYSRSGDKILIVNDYSFVSERNAEGPTLKPSKDSLGALVNLKNKEFFGVAFYVKMPLKDFEEILKTLEIVEIKDKTVDWKTYRNEEYGFEFKYPQDVFGLEEPSAVGTDNVDAVFTMDLHTGITENNGQDWYSVFFVVEVSNKNSVLSQKAANIKIREELEGALNKAYAGEKGIIIDKYYPYEVNGNKEVGNVVAKVIGSELLFDIFLSPEKNNYNYNIKTTLPFSSLGDDVDVQNCKLIEIFNQILSTFKFLN